MDATWRVRAGFRDFAASALSFASIQLMVLRIWGGWKGPGQFAEAGDGDVGQLSGQDGVKTEMDPARLPEEGFDLTPLRIDAGR